MEEPRKGRGKTWGFRRTTIAKREFLEEVGELLQESKPPPTRRGGRQARGRGRGRQAAVTNPTPISKRGRGGRKNAINVSHGSTSTDNTTEADCEAACLSALETSESEAVKTAPTEKHSQSEGTTDSEEISLQEYAERLKRRKQLEDKKAEQETKSKTNGAKREIVEKETSTEEEDVIVRQTGKTQTTRARSSQPSHTDVNDDTMTKRSQRSARVVRKSASRVPDTEEEEEESREDEAEAEKQPGGCESEDTDPDAVYCLCRQKHNKRFMICCDRCQEWFHGDCVGISEKRGRLMEKDGEDYICPNCSPCPSPAPLQTLQTTLSATGMSSASDSVTESSTCENRPSGDEGIKGKIRKASSEGVKKKIKIFQPGMVRPVVVKKKEEEETLSNCIGPGCSKSALPDSVYCGHDCILRHAAVAMKSLSEQKTPKPEPLPEVNPTPPKPISKPTLLSALKAQMKPLLGKVARKRSSGVEVEDQSGDKEKKAAVLPSTQAEAVKPQQSSSIDSAVFYKSSKKAALNIDSKTETDDLGKHKSPSVVKPFHMAPAPTSRIMQADFNLLPLNSKPAVASVPISNTTAPKQQPRATPSVDKASSFPPQKSPSTSQSSPAALSCSPAMPSMSQQNSQPAVQLVSESKQEPTSSPSVEKALPPLPKPSPQPSPPSTSPPSPTAPSCSPAIASMPPLSSKSSPQLVSDSTAPKQQPKAAPNVDKTLPPFPKKSPQPSPPSTSPSSPTAPSCSPAMASMSHLSSKPAVELVSDSVVSKQQPKAAPSVDKAIPPLPKKSPQPSPPSTSPSSSSCSPAMASTSQQVPQTPQMPSEPKPKPSIQIRINVRRSLTDMLWKRVNDDDDLTLPQSEVGNLAVNIEKAIYNMYNSTDSRYKNKYRLMMFNLKDPKNQVLFYRVIRGEIPPSKLTRLSQDELQAKEPSSSNISEAPVTHQSSPEIEEGKQDLKRESAISVATEKNTQLSCVATCKSEDSPLLSAPSQNSGIKQNQPAKMQPVAIPDIISSMLKDTTSEHRTHLFDLKCRICTGQISADDDEGPASKRLKKSEPEEKPEKLETSHKERPSKISRAAERRTTPVVVPRVKSPVMESPASPVPEETADAGEEPSDFTPIVIPEVSIVSVTRQDPRTAPFRPAIKPKLYQPLPPTTPVISESKPVKPPPLPPPPPPAVPKSILTKPTGSSVRLFSTSRPPTSVVCSKPSLDQDTRQFLLKQETIWKGFLNMQTVAKFVTKGYLVSGSSKYLNEDIPDTIHIGGRILPQTVWEYVERVKTSPSKDLCLIRFQPATDEEEVAYVSLFSYFNSRRRFGVVSNHCTYIKDFYLIPLGAHESVPSPLLPLEGPGFEQNRPNLMLGLAICQKPKPPDVLKEEVDETRFKAKTVQSSESVFLAAKTITAGEKPYDCQPYDPEIPMCTTPPGSPDSSSSGSMASPSDLAQSVLSIIKAPPAGSSKSITDSTPSASTNKNPLQTILKTLFGKKEEPPENAAELPTPSPSTDTKPTVPKISEVDVIVQKYGNSSTVAPIDNSEISKDDDRPYDPEEEYDPEVEYGMLNQTSTIPVKKEVEDDDRPYDPEEYDPAVGYHDPKSPVKTFEDKTVAQQSAVEDDVAYDPEDSTFFEEMQADLAGNSGGTDGTVVLTEQQKMLLELNKQIEEQKRQLEEQEEALSRQRAAAGMSMAHFSVSDALLSPPRTSYLSQCDLLQLVEKQNIDTVIPETTVKPVINERRDPRQKRGARCVESNPVDIERDDKCTLSGSSKSETIPPIMNDIQKSRQGTSVSAENKTNTEKNPKMTPTEKVDKTVSDDKSKVKEFAKTDTHTKAKSHKTEKTEKLSDTRRHSHHHRSRHEPRRSSRGDSRDVSPRKRRRSGDNREVKPSQTSSVSIKKREKDKHDRDQFERRDTHISFSRQRSRERQRREFEPKSEGPQRASSFHGKQGETAPDNRYRDRGPGQNSTPKGPPSRQFSDPDCHTPHTSSQGEPAPDDRFRDRGPGQNSTPKGPPSRQFSDSDCHTPHTGRQGEPAPDDRFRDRGPGQNSTPKGPPSRQLSDPDCHTPHTGRQGEPAPDDRFRDRGPGQNSTPKGPPPRQFSDPDCHTPHTGRQGEPAPDDRFRDRGPGQNSTPKGPPSRQFSDPDCHTPHTGRQGEPAPDDRFRDRGPGQNSAPKGPPSRQFSDPDCQTPHTFDTPFHSNQYDGPRPPMHQLGPRGRFGRPHYAPFENRGPRPPRLGPPGPPFRLFNMGSGPRMPNVGGPWKSNDNKDFDGCQPFHDDDSPVPPHMFRENQGDFSFIGPPNEPPEMHRGGDLEWGVQRPNFTPNRFDDHHGHNALERTGPEFFGSGPCENFRNREMVQNRRASCPDPLDRSSDPRVPLQRFPTLGSPQQRQTFEELSHHPDHHGPRDCPPFSRPRGHTTGPFLDNKVQPVLNLEKPDNQSDAPPRRHSGALLPTPPGGPIGLFNSAMQGPPQDLESPWPPQNPAGRRGGFDREVSESDNTRTGPDHFEEGCQKDPRENKEPSQEHTREQSEERRMSDGSMPTQRDRRPWPQEQSWKRDNSREGDKSNRGDIGESEGETRRPMGGRDRDLDRRDPKRARIRDGDRDRDSYCSGQESRNQSFHERTRGRGQRGGRFRGFGRKRSRGRERYRERS